MKVPWDLRTMDAGFVLMGTFGVFSAVVREVKTFTDLVSLRSD